MRFIGPRRCGERSVIGTPILNKSGNNYYKKFYDNYNKKVKNPYRKLLLANAKRSRKQEANLCDFEMTLCLYYLTMLHFIKRAEGTEGGRLLQILRLRKLGANSNIYGISFVKGSRAGTSSSLHKRRWRLPVHKKIDGPAVPAPP